MNSAYVTEANKISGSGAWIWLLEIATGSWPAILRYTNNNDDVVWAGNGYTSMPFTIDDVNVSTSGAFPEYTLYVGDVDTAGALHTYIRAGGGLVGNAVHLMVVHSEHLAVTTAAVDEITEILSCELGVSVITFKLGMPSLLSRRLPRDRYAPSYCRHKFGGALCQYSIPTEKVVSNQVLFVPMGAYDYDIISVLDGGLLNLFDDAPGLRYSDGNLITNGGFESIIPESLAGWHGTGHYYGWETWGSTSTTTRYVTVEKAKFDTHSLLIQCNTSTGGVYQIISVTAGKTYTLSCWVFVRHTTGAGAYGVRMRTEVTPGLGYTEAYSTYGGWIQLSLTVTPTTNQLTIWLGGHGQAFFDGVSVVEGSVVADYTQRLLINDIGFIVSGSASNDGEFLTWGLIDIRDTSVRVRHLSSYATDRVFVAESAGNEVTLTLGYIGCDHTLAACRIRSNSQNFGGSPGIRGGVYG